MSRNLLLTFGHNSSAILVDDDKIICGYEEERLSKVKSDSSFPRLAIMQCLNSSYIDKLDTIYISYWNDDFSIFDGRKINDHHIDKKFLDVICKQYGASIKYLSDDFTHHDAHAYGALNFFENHATEEEKNLPFYVAVSDGFGNKEEVFSLYKLLNGKLEKILKIQGYGKSMGLMYQYATSFCGMKENEDEYKFLGYESHIKEVLNDSQIDKLYEYSNAFISNLANETLISELNEPEWTDYIDVKKLADVRDWWTNEYKRVLELVGFEKGHDDIEKIRCIIATFIQNNIEQFIGHILSKYDVKNVILAGGIFYNVKLNNYVMNHIEGKICVYPLAGDQGCGIGCYRYYAKPLKFNDLFFGKRNLKIDESKLNSLNLKNFEYYDDKSKFIDRITELLKEDKIVNIMTGDMEFGPRALGATTTMALPTKKNVTYINQLNHRNDVMPMAPQILKSKTSRYFNGQPDRIIGSNFYMIITMDQNHTPDKSYIGISHRYPLKDVYSSRCQVIDDDSNLYAAQVLKKISDTGNDFVINTSCNYHGTPILYSVNDMIRNHVLTAKNDTEDRSYSIVGAF